MDELNELDSMCGISDDELTERFKEAIRIENEIKKIEQKSKEPVIAFLKAFYDFGFYTGVNFMLDPDDLNEETIKKVYK